MSIFATTTTTKVVEEF